MVAIVCLNERKTVTHLRYCMQLRKIRRRVTALRFQLAEIFQRKKRQAVYQELNIHAQVQELAEKIVEFKRQKKGIDKSIEKVERELHVIFNNAKIDCMEVSMGNTCKKKKMERSMSG